MIKNTEISLLNHHLHWSRMDDLKASDVPSRPGLTVDEERITPRQ